MSMAEMRQELVYLKTKVHQLGSAKPKVNPSSGLIRCAVHIIHSSSSLFICLFTLDFDDVAAMPSDDSKGSAGSSDEGSDAWAKLDISPKAIGSVPYNNMRINIYQHSGNLKTGVNNGENKFYYSPIALLDTMSAISSFNNGNNQAEMKFRIEMWNEDVQSAVLARWIKQEV